jgi:hypothetical protein
MPSLVAKKKGNKLYYYVVESARVEGQPRIVHQAYLGTAEKLAEMVRGRTAPIPLAASMREFGLPAALWSVAQQTGVWDLLQSLWPAPRSGPSPPHYLLLAAVHRVCQPGPKTEVAEWYRKSILSALWDFSAERFTSQALWGAFEQILPQEQQDLPWEQDPLEKAQLALLGLWKEKQLVSRRLLAYDTTNFYTYIASTNTRNQLAQRGHNNARPTQPAPSRAQLCAGRREWTEPLSSRLSWPCCRCGGVFDRFGAHHPHAGSKPNCARDGHAGAGQRFGCVGQHGGLRSSQVRLDLGLALEPGAGGITQSRGRRVVGIQ